MGRVRWQPLEPSDEALLLRLAQRPTDVGVTSLIAATHLPLREGAWNAVRDGILDRLAEDTHDDHLKDAAEWLPDVVSVDTVDGTDGWGSRARSEVDEGWILSPAPGRLWMHDASREAGLAEARGRAEALTEEVMAAPFSYFRDEGPSARSLEPLEVTAVFEAAASSDWYDINLGNHLVGVISHDSTFTPDLDGLYDVYRDALAGLQQWQGELSLPVSALRDDENAWAWLSWHVAWTVSRAGIADVVSGLRPQLDSEIAGDVVVALALIADAADFAVQPEPEFYGGGLAPARLGVDSPHRVFPPDPVLLSLGQLSGNSERTTALPSPGRGVARPRRVVDAVSVFYATNRAVGNLSIPRQAYRNEADAGNAVHYGVASVEIPSTHRFGSTGTPVFRRWVRFEFGSDHLTVGGVETFGTADQFYAAVRAFGATESERTALVYIHGYNVSFRACVVRAAQMSYDLGHHGVTAAFSWPSRARARKYFSDRERIEASEGGLADFLGRLATDTGLKRVHIIAHSMGNRGLARAFQRMQGVLAGTGIVYGQIVLAAPDIDVELFRELAAVYAQVSERTTLYASSRDRALKMSRYLQDSDRAGFFSASSPVTIVPGVDTVAVSNIDVTRLDLGHGVYAEAQALLYDIGQLLRDGAPPGQRQRLSPATTPDGEPYWVLRR